MAGVGEKKSNPGRRLRSAVIGTGKISEEHLRFLAADPRVSLEAVCDLSPSLAKYAVARFGAKRAFTDSSRMIQEAKPDVVHVLTPPHTHFKLVTDALEGGAHVLVEKPVAGSNREFRELWSLAQARGRRIVEDHNYRFNEPILAIEKLVREGELGEVREVDVRMALPVRKAGGRYSDANLPHPSHKMPAGVIHEFITHLCYLALRFVPGEDHAMATPARGSSFGALPSPLPSPGVPGEGEKLTAPGSSAYRIAAAWSKHGDDALFKYDDLDALVIGGPVHARIRFTSHAAPDCFSVVVRGTRGWAETDLFQPHLRVVVPRKGGQQLSPLVNQFVNGAELMSASVRGFRNKVMQKTPYEGLRTFLDRTYDALVDGNEPPVTFEDMDRASRLVDALLESRV